MMKTNLVKSLIAVSILAAGTGVFTSCKDYDADIAGIKTTHQEDIATVNALISTVTPTVVDGQLCIGGNTTGIFTNGDCVTGVSVNSDGKLQLTFKDGTTNVVEIENLTVIKDLMTDVANLQSRATSVSVDGINNPVFGMVKTAADVQTNMLFGFYGPGSKQTFPTGIGATKTVTVAADPFSSYIGTVYYTINPTNVDFTGATINLVSSTDSASNITMSAIKASSETLMMGYTRPLSKATSTGFYESDATVSDPTKVAHIDIPAAKLIEYAKTIKNGSNTDRLSAVISSIRETAAAFKTPAYAMQISKTNGDVAKSGLNVQAALIKPASYEDIAKLPETTEWAQRKTVELVNKIIKKVVEKAQSKLTSSQDYKDVRDLINKLQKDAANANISFSNNGVTIDVKSNGSVIGTITEAELASLYKSLNDGVKDVNSMITDLNDACKKANEILNKIEGTSLVTSTQSTAEELINEVWDKLDRVYQAGLYRFDLALFLNDNGSYKYVRSNITAPTEVSSSFTAYLTNLNAELITPACQKHLMVKNCATGTVVAEENVPGTTKKVAVSGLVSGDTYECIYTGLDYFGKQESRSFYVKCK